MLKYDTTDARDVLERASARETAARTVVGYGSKQLLRTIGVDVLSHVVAIGDIEVPPGAPVPGPEDLAAVDASPVRCFHASSSAAMVEAIDEAHESKDTLGGIVEVLAHGVPVGIGSHVHWDRRLDTQLAGALMSVQAIKAVEIGDGWSTASRRGSEAHDEIEYEGGEFRRPTDRAGGIEGGMSTGQVVRARAAMKPISTLNRPLNTVDVTTKERDKAFRERTDTCAVPAAGVVAEQMVAFVFASEAQRSFGGDTVADFAEAAAAYRKRIAGF